MRRLVPLAILLLLGSCTLFESPAERAMRNSPDYKVGYSDGCSSAFSGGNNPRDTALNRDEDAYRTNKAYRTGWGTGFNGCRATPAGGGVGAPARGPIPDPMPGQTPF